MIDSRAIENTPAQRALTGKRGLTSPAPKANDAMAAKKGDKLPPRNTGEKPELTHSINITTPTTPGQRRAAEQAAKAAVKATDAKQGKTPAVAPAKAAPAKGKGKTAPTPAPVKAKAAPAVKNRAYTTTKKGDDSRADSFRTYMISTIRAHKNTADAKAAHAASGKFSHERLNFKWAHDNGYIVLKDA